MPTYKVQVSLCRNINSAGDRGNPVHRLRDYDGGRGLGADTSVYSTRSNSIQLVRSVDECACCHQKRELVNGYCEVCRACGANEHQCMNTVEIQHRQTVGRNNSKTSTWRMK